MKQALIDDNKVEYDMCSSENKEASIARYKHSFTYIGSGNITFHNGSLNEWPTVLHFFKRNEPLNIFNPL